MFVRVFNVLCSLLKLSNNLCVKIFIIYCIFHENQSIHLQYATLVYSCTHKYGHEPPWLGNIDTSNSFVYGWELMKNVSRRLLLCDNPPALKCFYLSGLCLPHLHSHRIYINLGEHFISLGYFTPWINAYCLYWLILME